MGEEGGVVVPNFPQRESRGKPVGGVVIQDQKGRNNEGRPARDGPRCSCGPICPALGGRSHGGRRRDPVEAHVGDEVAVVLVVVRGVEKASTAEAAISLPKKLTILLPMSSVILPYTSVQ